MLRRNICVDVVCAGYAVRDVQARRKLVWLPHPTPKNAIGQALRIAFPRDSVEQIPQQLASLLILLSDHHYECIPPRLNGEDDPEAALSPDQAHHEPHIRPPLRRFRYCQGSRVQVMVGSGERN